jgi:uncharacterized protein (DUF58 family)
MSLEDQNSDKHEEILKRVSNLEIKTRLLVESRLSGNYHSRFKGQGMQFSEFREYVPGDEIRHISWTVSARTKAPVVKLFEEERELNILFLLDISASDNFGTQYLNKRDILAESCAAIAFSAVKNSDNIGLINFSDQVETMIPLKSGKTHALRIVREMLYSNPENTGTNINVALKSARHILKHRSVIVLASDFLGGIDFEKNLAEASRSHDFIVLHVSDPREREIPACGLVQVKDPETGKTMVLDTTFKKNREKWNQCYEEHLRNLSNLFLKNNIDALSISTEESPIEKMIRFFESRGRTKHILHQVTK